MLSKVILSKFNWTKQLSLLYSFERLLISNHQKPISQLQTTNLKTIHKFGPQAKNYFSTGKNVNVTVPVVYYEEVKNLPKHPEILLVDVRENEEVKKTGRIPASIHIPLGTIDSVLSSAMDANMFKQKFGRSKPDSKSPIIFYCLKGMRSQIAAETAIKIGYKNVKNYVGSWQDWVERENN